MSEILSPCPKNHPAPGRVFWCWDINFVCNYKCSYCHLQQKDWRHPQGDTRHIETGAMVKIWTRIYELYGKCHLHISGGEPSVYPDFFNLVEQLSRIHTLEFDTNFSFDTTNLIKKVESGRVKINASFHPEMVDFNVFYPKLLQMKDNGFRIGVSLVGYPPFLSDLAKYREACIKNNVEMTIQAFRGNYEGKEYPHAYTDSEKKLIQGVSMSGETEENDSTSKILHHHTVDALNKERRLCRMGQMCVKVYPNGNVFRCCKPDVSEKVGNIYLDPNFKLLDEPGYCEIVPCPCWRAMIVGKEEEWQHRWFMM